MTTKTTKSTRKSTASKAPRKSRGASTKVKARQEQEEFLDSITQSEDGEAKKITPIHQLSPQCRKIIRHIMKAGSISPDEAITYYRIMSLPRRILDLKAAGYDIESERRNHPVSGQHYKRYFIPGGASSLRTGG